MISVIMPVYNAGKYLKETIASVFSQSYKDWELILIDDGSADGSGIICDEEARDNPGKIISIHKANGGVSSARNVGLEACRGDFVFFMDADDLLPGDALQNLADVQAATGAGIVCGAIEKIKAEIPAKPRLCHSISEVYSSEEAICEALYQRKINNSMSGKLFAKSLWTRLRFKEDRWYEDLDIFYKLFLDAQNIAVTKCVCYYYVQHAESYIHNFSLGRADMLTVTADMVKYMEENYPQLLPAAKSRQLSANFNMLMLLAANREKIVQEDRERADALVAECREKIKSLRREVLFNRASNLKNKVGVIATYLLGFSLSELIGKYFYR